MDGVILRSDLVHHREKCLFEIDTKKGDTNRSSQHMTEHKSIGDKRLTITQDLTTKSRQDIANAATMAVIFDLIPMGFTDNKEDMAAYAESVFSTGQSLPHGVSISKQFYLHSRNTVKASLEHLATDLRQQFTLRISTEMHKLGGAITIEVLTLKLLGNHYYDFTNHYVKVEIISNASP